MILFFISAGISTTLSSIYDYNFSKEGKLQIIKNDLRHENNRIKAELEKQAELQRIAELEKQAELQRKAELEEQQEKIIQRNVEIEAEENL